MGLVADKAIVFAALENILTDIIFGREEKARLDALIPSPLAFKAIKASEFSLKEPVPSRNESRLKTLASKGLCREEMAMISLQWVGEHLHKRGGLDLMHSVAYEVAARNPSREGYMLDICSKRWDGIGDWHA